MAMASSDTRWKVIKSAFSAASTKVSDNARTFAISAIGVIWLFKTEIKPNGEQTTYEIPDQLAIAALFVFVFLVLDFIQYFYKTIVWHYYKSKAYKKLGQSPSEDETILVCDCVNTPVSFIFYSKCVFIILAYYKIICFLISVVKISH